jgi:hypothetical protein
VILLFDMENEVFWVDGLLRMIQGWHNEDYLILFEEQLESISMTARYGAKTFLPGYTLDGLKGWDDFIVHDTAHNFYTVPTVPVA